MPKAVIRTPQPVGLTDMLTPDTSSHLHVQVGWDKGLAQIQVGVNGVDPATGETNIVGPFATLDWTGSNALIAAIREARDQAFGKPE